MKIVIDTNVVISGTFFGGAPRRVIESVGKNGIHACATPEIIEEYEEIVEEMIDRKQGHIRRDVLAPFIAGLELIAPKTKVEVSRDPDDDKFIGCALDAKALYIVSGDKDLLDIGRYENVEMITAAEFCSRYLPL
ncbi:MAG: putative toxin-antitoxin system toxin component, PIN family [Parasporobacterium sp.]|jgi:putative PIN family toxin of toxin-antitoxin system|nr:putative toxin-antitoxin system toxin component, PIN family [Lachnospiraceae bacterium]MBR3245308.1 putative toxin-antitoxin system toxin component, PIN family [Parasporobacterium sp.]